MWAGNRILRRKFHRWNRNDRSGIPTTYFQVIFNHPISLFRNLNISIIDTEDNELTELSNRIEDCMNNETCIKFIESFLLNKIIVNTSYYLPRLSEVVKSIFAVAKQQMYTFEVSDIWNIITYHSIAFCFSENSDKFEQRNQYAWCLCYALSIGCSHVVLLRSLIKVVKIIP